MKKNIKLDMNQIKDAFKKLSFLKNYSFLLLPVIIIFVAIVLYLPTPIINRNLQQRIQQESISKGRSLATLGNQVVSKDQWMQDEKLSLAYLADVERATELALQTSQRPLISYNIFPEPKGTSIAIFKQFGNTFQDELKDLVKSAGGGTRPTDIELGLSGDRGAARPTGQISDKVRDDISLKRALSISFYADVYDLNFYNYWSTDTAGIRQRQGDFFEYTGVDSAVEACWYTQVGYWIIEDVLATIKAVNRDTNSGVYGSAVKRLIDFNFGLTSDKQTTGTVKALPEYVFAPQVDYGYGYAAPTTTQPSTVVTLTGNSSKGEIDVVHFNMSLAIDSEKMMQFMKELCSVKEHTFMGFDGQGPKRDFRRNQITILDADFEVIDRDAAEHRYYRYGDAAVVKLVLSCEYIFNKQGYSEVKPVVVKKHLGEDIGAGSFDDSYGRDSEHDMMY